MRQWRMHEVPTKDVVPSWQYCQDAECSKGHYLFKPFIGVIGPVAKWEGVLHK